MAKAKKSQVSSEDKFEQQDFDLFRAIEAVDRKDYQYFDTLTEEQRKRFVPYMMLHWISSVKGARDLTAYYLMSTDLAANKHMFNEAVYNHPQLQWLMLCASSPGMGKQFHQYIPHLSSKIGQLRETVSKKEIVDYLNKIYKNDSADDIEAVADIMIQHINHKVKLATLYPEMKYGDVSVLAECVATEDIAQYESESGIY